MPKLPTSDFDEIYRLYEKYVYSRTVQMKSAFYHFEILPEFEPIIIDDGISAENREKLKNLFVLE